MYAEAIRTVDACKKQRRSDEVGGVETVSFKFGGVDRTPEEGALLRTVQGSLSGLGGRSSREFPQLWLNSKA